MAAQSNIAQCNNGELELTEKEEQPEMQPDVDGIVVSLKTWHKKLDASNLPNLKAVLMNVPEQLILLLANICSGVLSSPYE